jgi:hypothetical protein
MGKSSIFVCLHEINPDTVKLDILSNPEQMKRRKFIVLAGMSAAAVTVPFYYCKRADPELVKKLATPHMLSHILDANGIAGIGQTYGRTHRDEYTSDALMGLLQKNAASQTASSITLAEDTAFGVEKNVQQDFETGNFVVVSGWVLSLTEARQCALFSLIQL